MNKTRQPKLVNVTGVAQTEWQTLHWEEAPSFEPIPNLNRVGLVLQTASVSFQFLEVFLAITSSVYFCRSEI